MSGDDFVRIIRKYKHCPWCNVSYKGHSMSAELHGDCATIKCVCGFKTTVDKDNKEVRKEEQKC